MSEEKYTSDFLSVVSFKYATQPH